ncbi:MAG: metal ABC transporter ATP-binding protein [Eubacterium sp.]|nr:metal ABC transporter ATP-binding protein [Eubacterium sp.]
MSYIEAKHLTTGYDGIPLTKHINFTVEKGDYLCIVGENGAGKSTLMKTLLRLIPAVKGEIVYSDEIGPKDMGYLSQQNKIQKDFPASVWEIVLSGNLSKTGLRPFYNKAEKKSAEENLKKMDAWELRKKTFRNLSGGQQQRVLLARALCATTKLILLDEPVSGLDPKVTEELYSVVKKLNEDGVTIIMISHDISTAVRYSSHILHLGHKQLFFGKTEDYLESDAYKFFSTVEASEDDEEEANNADNNDKKSISNGGNK